MRLTLDLDRISYENVKKRLGVLELLFKGRKYEIYSSASKHGFHLVVYAKISDFDELILLRKWFGDDRRRIKKDIERNEDNVETSVLFTTKRGKKSVLVESGVL